jgi:histidine triad (HIT) family protein
MSECLFCKIVRGEQEAYKVMDEEHCTAFLDHRPVFPGHVLLVPKAHHETLVDVPLQSLGPLMASAQRIARAIEVGLRADGYFVAMNNKVSQSVPHLHVHVVPRRKKDGLRGFFWPRVKQSDAELASMRDTLRKALADVQE